MLNSLLVQDYKNFELIIVDGNSTDKTLDKIKVFENKIKIKILQQNKVESICYQRWSGALYRRFIIYSSWR